MTVYGDTSWWIAYKCSDDVHHLPAIQFFERWPEAQVVWTPWHRVEVFNALRQLERAHFIAPGKARDFVRLIEQEVRLGYWPHRECNWRNAVRTACELSAEHGLSISTRPWIFSTWRMRLKWAQTRWRVSIESNRRLRKPQDLKSYGSH